MGSSCKGLSAADADGVRPKGADLDKSDGAETALRTGVMPTELVSKGKDRGRERTQTQTEGTELAIEFTVVYYGHGHIYTTKTCGLPVTSVLHQVRWSMHA